ncbi:hypothetical protein WICPIJ_009239 [Wickerhamomyces pijperi]|uniref:Transmembrane protein n=1 Tax=Wickerhamomyces pijperi TaxID=599730 RepID=A0A9P8TEU8_WICPI|nr:hypothetical protein WICPIJ_009239 [Wickerhamomyces pijperi]
MYSVLGTDCWSLTVLVPSLVDLWRVVRIVVSHLVEVLLVLSLLLLLMLFVDNVLDGISEPTHTRFVVLIAIRSKSDEVGVWIEVSVVVVVVMTTTAISDIVLVFLGKNKQMWDVPCENNRLGRFGAWHGVVELEELGSGDVWVAIVVRNRSW